MGKKVLKIAAWGLAALVALVLCILAYGAMLPPEHTFTRSVQLAQPPDAVYQVLADFSKHASWRPDVGRFEPSGQKDGKDTWLYVDAQGIAMRMTVETDVPPRHLVLHYVDDEGIADLTWDIGVGKIEGGSIVLVKEHGKIPGALFRAMNKLLCGTRYVDGLLLNLAKKFGQEAVIM